MTLSDAAIMQLLARTSDGNTGSPELLAAIEEGEACLRANGWRRDSLTGAEWVFDTSLSH